jgi:hypothetical protein
LRRGFGPVAGELFGGRVAAARAAAPAGAARRRSSSRCFISRRASFSCSSDNSMLVPQCQQSAIISQNRIDIGAWQSGQAHIKTSPFIQTESV